MNSCFLYCLLAFVSCVGQQIPLQWAIPIDCSPWRGVDDGGVATVEKEERGRRKEEEG
jgi:hypothetical protein